MAKKKNSHKTKSKNIIERVMKNIDKPMLIILGILLALLVACYITFGLEFTIVLLVGVLIILGIARLLDNVKSHKKRRKILNIILIIFFVFAILICIGVTIFCIMIVKISPDFDISKLNKKESSIFYDMNGVDFAKLGEQKRENISYDDLPEVFIDALIATEDSRYFQHNGFDAPRFIKASIGQVLGKNAGGASTLTMQLSKNTFTDPAQKRSHGLDGIIRKFEDIYISVFKLEKNYSKEEIIEYYVNNYDLGNNAWGVEEASQTLFSKSVTELNLSEAALLVGIFNNPTKYNPIYHPEASYNRRNTVLRLMVHHGYITQEEADIASNIPVSSLLNPSNGNSKYGAYTKAVYDELKNKYGINPNTTSVLVYTNMDRSKQEGIDKIMSGETFSWHNDAVQGAAAIIDVDTGKVVALAGGRNKGTLGLNLATQGKKQIGSTAKPIFDYGPAIEYLNWSTYQQIVDEPWQYSTGQVIGNSDGGFMGQISMRTALAQSRNIPALKAFQTVASEAGNNKIYEFATNLGIKPQTSNGIVYESHALGAFDGTTPLQMAAAYAAFANGGTYYEPTTINKIVYRNNNEVKTIKVEGKKAMSEATAYMITSMLETAVENGLSSGAKMNGVHVAAKTGTTNFDPTVKQKCHITDGVNDAWLVGYDPEYSIAMWYGYENMDNCNYNSSVTAVVQRKRLFQAIGGIIFTRDNKEFTVPSSVSRVCVEKGHMEATLPSQYTPEDQLVCEYFKKGHEPTTVSTAYNKLDKVKNLKVTYDEKKEKINITWDKVATPADSEESYGAFGYNVYYGDVLLGFVTDNSYSITANTNISGTYKVVTTYENYTNNHSDAATYEFTYTPQTTNPTTSPTTSPTASPKQ